MQERVRSLIQQATRRASPGRTATAALVVVVLAAPHGAAARPVPTIGNDVTPTDPVVATSPSASQPAIIPEADPGQLEDRLGGADHLVVVGADDPGSPPPPSKVDRFEYHAYYPDTLQVHRDDVVRFHWEGDHTVTFHPGGQRQDSLFVRDELPGDVRAEGFLPSRDDCAVGEGRDHLPPCVLDSPDQFLNTGGSIANPDFSATIQFSLPVGTHAYFCAFHPGMRGEIEVVDDDVPIATPAEVEDERRAQVAADTTAALAVVDSFVQPPRRIVDGRVRWQVQVGGRTPDGRVEILSYLPTSLVVEPDQEVEFLLPPAPGGLEWHTASFLPDQRVPVGGDAIGTHDLPFLTFFEFRCDPDDRDTGATGVPVGLPALLLGDGRCPDGGLVEFVYSPIAYREPLSSPAGIVAGPGPVHDSGLLATPQEGCEDSCDPWTGEPLPSRVDAFFPEEGTFPYVCWIHEVRGMTGSITVRTG